MTTAAALLCFTLHFRALYFSFPSRDLKHLDIDEAPPRHPFHTGRMSQRVWWAWPVELLTNCPAAGRPPRPAQLDLRPPRTAQVLARQIPERVCDCVKNWVEEGQQTPATSSTHWPHTHSCQHIQIQKGHSALNTDTSSLTSASVFFPFFSNVTWLLNSSFSI